MQIDDIDDVDDDSEKPLIAKNPYYQTENQTENTSSSRHPHLILLRMRPVLCPKG
jgi:hypothetical protein